MANNIQHPANAHYRCLVEHDNSTSDGQKAPLTGQHDCDALLQARMRPVSRPGSYGKGGGGVLLNTRPLYVTLPTLFVAGAGAPADGRKGSPSRTGSYPPGTVQNFDNSGLRALRTTGYTGRTLRTLLAPWRRRGGLPASCS